ncbi:non-ribosomal peptide synthetase [Nocardiopsis ganjiahuensis]|uniref:non-ribosomal peptide synthetase n=1 Tax=Nocardiopsis ganjiahuensis TaxID=239984 RepID=UPI00036F8C2B|nr:non-ribosomal peptide synthetase [Nocardiopsis ganjiahuensis]
MIETVREQVAEVLGTRAFTDTDDLFEHGLDSLGMIRLSGAWREKGFDVTFEDLAAVPTVAAWSALLRDAVAVPLAAGPETVRHRAEGEPFPLATMQHAYWIGRQDDQPLGAVAAHFYTEFDGAGVDPDRLARALRAVVERHPMLRARFDDDGLQRVEPAGAQPAVTVRDLREATADEVGQALETIREEATHRRMDVAAGEVLDIALSLLPGGATRLHVDLDMIVADALSLRVLLEDLRGAYLGEDAPPLEYGFADYLADRRERGSGPRERARDWWRTRLAEIPPPPALPVRPEAEAPARPTDPVTRSTRLHHRLTPERARAFERRARDFGVTPAAALATAFAEVLGAWNADPGFSLNLPLFDRAPLHPQVDRLVGDFSSSVLLGVDTTTPVPFAERARTLQGDLHRAVDHGAYGGVEVLRDLTRRNGGTPVLAPVVYTSAIGLGPLFTDNVQECFGRPSWIISQGPQVLLDAQVTELDDGLLLNWDLRARAFEPGTMEAAFDCYRNLVESLVDDPRAWESRFEPVPSAAQVRARAATALDLPEPAPRPLHASFFAHARAHPGDIALVPAAGEALTYGDLADRALRVAAGVQARVPAGATVAVHLPRGADQVAAILGVLAAGCAYLPVSPAQPAARRERILALGAPELVLTDTPDLRPGSEAGVLTVEQTRGLAPATGRNASPDSVAYVLFTSGSTGDPKGVEVEHRSAAHTVDVLTTALGAGGADRTLCLAEYDFDMSVFDLFAPLSVGGAAVLVESGDRRDADRWARTASDTAVTVLNCVPAFLDMLLSAVESGTAPMPPLRAVLLGGDRIAPALAGRLRAQAPECRFLALGGMTEAAVHSTLLEVDEADPSWSCVPWGRPLPGVSCRVVDALGRDRPDLVPGELWVAGAGLARGYRGAPELTAERFVTSRGQRWYRTGDLARHTPDGSLEFLGRNDHQVKVNGVRVETGEVEAALTAHPDVSAAVAVVLESPAPRLAAVVVPREALRNGTADAAAKHTHTLLPQAMVPDPVLELPELPLSPNGKPDRAAVTRHLRDHLSGGTGRHEPPRGETEALVARVWSELLEAPEPARTDSFFTLGGDSLLATRAVAALRRAGHPGARVSRLFAHPVLQDFAATLTERGETAVDQRVRHDADTRYDPFPATGVQRAYLTGRSPDFTLGGVGTYHYTEFDGEDVDLRRVEHALDRLVVRHDMLRAVFDGDGNQRVLPGAPPVRIPVTDAREQRDPGPALEAFRDTMAHQVLDPTRWPLFDVRALRYTREGVERVRLGVGLDYLVLDALSIMTLYTELDLLYREPDARLEPVDVTFRDYLTQVGTDPGAEERARHYWRERITELPPAPDLPLRVDPAEIERPRFTRRSRRLAPQEWSALTELARTVGITPSALLLACYGEVLSAWSGQTGLSVTLTLFNRQDAHPHVERVLGDFTSLSLASYRREPGEDPVEAARALQHLLGRDLDHREASAEWVLRELARRTGTAQPGIPVVFTGSLGVGTGVSMDRSPEFPRRVWGLSQSPQVHLDNQVMESGGSLEVSWDAVEELFRPGVLDAMFAAYLELLSTLARDGEQAWGRAVSRLLPQGQSRSRASAGRPGGDPPEGLLQDAFFGGAPRRPDAPALITDQETLTHGQTADRALRIAAGLVERGVRPGDAVAVCLPKGPEQVCAVLGVLAAGAVYVPVGAGQPELRRVRVHRAAGTVLAIGDGTGAPRSASVADLLESAPLESPVRPDPAQAAYTIFTSGSTGEPKGVEVSHTAALNTVEDINQRYRVGPRDRVLALSALDFDLSVYDVFGLLGAGGALVLPDEEERRDAERWRSLCADHGVTVWNTVPALLDMLVLASRKDGFPPDLRLALVSGDWVGTDLASALNRAAVGTHLVALGGATEAAIWSNAFDGGHVPLGWTSVPYGYPLRNQRYRVVDPHGRDCPDWVPGELWIGGAGVALGYRGDPERTADRFVDHEGERWYRTGDRGRYRPGTVLEFLGRTDRQVKIGGHRLELGEIEAALEAHPDVSRAAVVAPGERGARTTAAFVASGTDAPTPAELVRHLARHLPGHAVPGHVTVLDELPLTPNGKVDTAALGTLAADRDGQGREPLADAAEKMLAELWGDLLEAAVDDRHANFFVLGGTSLLAVRMMTLLRQRVDDRLSVRSFLADPTLASLADQVRAHTGDDVRTGVI